MLRNLRKPRNIQRLWFIGSVLTLASVFLPWWDITDSTASGAGPFVILTLAGSLIALAGLIKLRLRVYAMTLIVLGTILCFADAIAALGLVAPLGMCGIGMCWQLSWGFYSAVIGATVMLLSLRSKTYGASSSGRTIYVSSGRLPLRFPFVSRIIRFAHNHLVAFFFGGLSLMAVSIGSWTSMLLPYNPLPEFVAAVVFLVLFLVRKDKHISLFFFVSCLLFFHVAGMVLAVGNPLSALIFLFGLLCFLVSLVK